MHDGRFQYNIFKRKHHSEDLVVEARIILSWFLEKYHMNTCTGVLCFVDSASRFSSCK